MRLSTGPEHSADGANPGGQARRRQDDQPKASSRDSARRTRLAQCWSSVVEADAIREVAQTGSGPNFSASRSARTPCIPSLRPYSSACSRRGPITLFSITLIMPAS